MQRLHQMMHSGSGDLGGGGMMMMGEDGLMMKPDPS
jgi:hypothetical protein